MVADIIDLADRRSPPKPPPDGAREALIHILGKSDDPAELADALLTKLWICGFKVVPLEPGDG